MFVASVYRLAVVAMSEKQQDAGRAIFGRISFNLLMVLFTGSQLAATDDVPNQPDLEKACQNKDAERQTNRASIIGTIVSSDNSPVAGIKILAFESGRQLEQEFVSDDQGKFQVPKAWQSLNGHLMLVARDGDQRLGWFDFFFQADSDEASFRIMLLPINRTVRGRLVDEAGKPLANINLHVQHLQHEINFTSARWHLPNLDEVPLLAGALTDIDGRYELKIPADTSGWVKPAHPDFVARWIQVPNDTASLPDTKLAQAAKIAGRVLDSRNQKPMAGVIVAARSTQRDMDLTTAKTDASGNYVIEGLASGECNVFLLRVGFKTLTAAAQTVDLSPSVTRREVDFLLSFGNQITGRVLDVDTNRPIAGCTVNCSTSWRPTHRDLSTKSNSNGEFEFFVPPGEKLVYIADLREDVPGQVCKIDVCEDQDTEPVVLKTGRKLDGPCMKIFLGPALDRKISAHFEGITLGDALKRFCHSAGVELHPNAEIEAIEAPVSIDVDGLKLRSVMSLILHRFGKCSIEPDGYLVFVGNRADIAEMEINSKLSRCFNCAYEDLSLEDVLAELASRLRIAAVIDDGDIRAAGLEESLTTISSVATAETYQQIIRDPEDLSNRFVSVVRRRDGTITSRELLNHLLEPLALGFYVQGDELHVTTAQKVDERNREAAERNPPKL